MTTVHIQTKIVHAETARGAEVIDAEAHWRWQVRPVARSRGWHSGVLEINGLPYRCECSFVESDGHCWQVVDLFKPGGKHVRVTVGPDGVRCDCEHATYRGVLCKHAAAVPAALEEQERWERAEWSAALDRETAERRGIVPPF